MSDKSQAAEQFERMLTAITSTLEALAEHQKTMDERIDMLSKRLDRIEQREGA